MGTKTPIMSPRIASLASFSGVEVLLQLGFEDKDLGGL